MKVVVTGHHGFIGSVLAPFLREAGHSVHGVDTFLYRGCDFGAEAAFRPYTEIDIRELTSTDLAGYDAVVHLAALSNDPVGDLNTALTYAINLDATVALARASREAGVRRFVFASSCSTYGASGTDDLLDENASQRPLTAYAESKVRSEERLSALADADFSPVYMRNATAYGVSPRLRLDVALNNLVAHAHTSGRVKLLSDGSSWRPMVHIEDIARATLALLEAPRELVHDQSFNIGSSAQNVRIRELAEMLSARSGCAVELSDEASPDPRSYRVDFGKLERTLSGFRCAWDVERGADELYAAFAEVGLRAADLDGSQYIRLRRVKKLLADGALDEDLRWTPGIGGVLREGTVAR